MERCGHRASHLPTGKASFFLGQSGVPRPCAATPPLGPPPAFGIFGAEREPKSKGCEAETLRLNPGS